MNQKISFLSVSLVRVAVLGLGLTLVGSGHAATVSFNAPVTITDDTVLDQPFSYTNATFVEALNFVNGTGSVTVTTTASNSVTFTDRNAATTSNLPAAAPGSTTLYNAGFQTLTPVQDPDVTTNANFNLVLRTDAWHNNSSDATRPLALTLAGLTIGQSYVISLFSYDARQSDRTQAYFDTFSGGTFSGGSSSSFNEQSAIMVLGTFTADATTQSIYIKATDAVGNADTTISAFSLYSFTAVPEPHEFALAIVALLGVMVFIRRRNQQA
jgi:hypothetical protein